MCQIPGQFEVAVGNIAVRVRKGDQSPLYIRRKGSAPNQRDHIAGIEWNKMDAAHPHTSSVTGADGVRNTGRNYLLNHRRSRGNVGGENLEIREKFVDDRREAEARPILL